MRILIRGMLTQEVLMRGLESGCERAGGRRPVHPPAALTDVCWTYLDDINFAIHPKLNSTITKSSCC